jgi:hypothetical protein
MSCTPRWRCSVQQACLHMHDPYECHLALIKRILRYVRGTTSFGLHLHASSSTSLTVYTDADWAGCPDTRRSTSGYCIFFGESLVSWSSKRSPRCPAPARRRNTARWLMLRLSASGFGNFWASSIALFTALRWPSATMSRQST